MSYARSVLQPNEEIVVVGRLQWIIYWRAIVFALAGIVVFAWMQGKGFNSTVTDVIGAVFLGLFLVSFLHAWFVRWITEFAVTNKRVIWKTGFITRHTLEMNMDKVESVDVDQSILGRMLDYGTIHVRGTGESIEHLHRIAHPLQLRSAITAH